MSSFISWFLFCMLCFINCFSEPLGFDGLVLPSMHPGHSKPALNVDHYEGSLTFNAGGTLCRCVWRRKGFCCTVFDETFASFSSSPGSNSSHVCFSEIIGAK